MSLFHFQFKFSGERDGWANARVWSDDEDISPYEMDVSDISGDSLGDLASAVNALWQGHSSATCSWADEPGEFRWCLTKDNESVRVRILHFRASYKDENEKGVVCFEIVCPLLAVAVEVEKQIHQILDDTGTDGYEKEWGVPFPMEELTELQHNIRQHKGDAQ